MELKTYVVSRVFLLISFSSFFFLRLNLIFAKTKPLKESCPQFEVAFFHDEKGVLDENSAYDILSSSKKLIPPKTVTYGFSSGFVWVGLFRNINCRFRKKILEIKNPLLDKVELFLVKGHIIESSIVLGDRIKFEERAFQLRNIVFELKEKKENISSYLIKVTSTTSMTIPLALYGDKEFYSVVNKDGISTYSFYFVMLLIIAFALLHSFSFHDKAYVLYSFYVGFMLLFFMCRDGILFEFIWPTAPEWQQKAPRFFASLAMIFGILYYKRILRVEQYIVDKAAYFYTIMALFYSLATIALDPQMTYSLTIVFAYFEVALMIILSIFGILEKKELAIYLLIGGLVSFLGLFIHTMSLISYIPINEFTHEAMKISTFIEFLILAIGMHMVIKKKEVIYQENQAYKVIVERLAHDIEAPIQHFQAKIKNVTNMDKIEIVPYLEKGISTVLEELSEIKNYILTHKDPDMKDKQGKAAKLSDNVHLWDGMYNINLQYSGAVALSPTNLNRIYFNLSKNAREGTSGNIKAKYWIESKDLGDNVQVIFGNDYSKIDKKSLSKIFNLHFSINKKGGNGIGLHSVRQIVKNAGGQIWAESNGYSSNRTKVQKKYDFDYVEVVFVIPKIKGEELNEQRNKFANSIHYRRSKIIFNRIGTFSSWKSIMQGFSKSQ